MATAMRHLRPRGQGAFTWLNRPADDDARRVFVHLLLAGQPVPLQMDDLAERLRMRTQALVKALFALNRQESVSVIEGTGAAASWQADGLLAGLNQDLADVARIGQGLVLASADGLALGQTGLLNPQAEAIAAGHPALAPSEGWTSGVWRVGGHHFVLWWTQALDDRQPGLLRLLARLLRAHGESPETQA